MAFINGPLSQSWTKVWVGPGGAVDAGFKGNPKVSPTPPLHVAQFFSATQARTDTSE